MENILNFASSFGLIMLGVFIAYTMRAQLSVARRDVTFQWSVFFAENKVPFTINSILTVLVSIWISVDAVGLEALLDNLGFGWAQLSRVLIGIFGIPHVASFFGSHVKVPERNL